MSYTRIINAQPLGISRLLSQFKSDQIVSLGATASIQLDLTGSLEYADTLFLSHFNTNAFIDEITGLSPAILGPILAVAGTSPSALFGNAMVGGGSPNKTGILYTLGAGSPLTTITGDFTLDISVYPTLSFSSTGGNGYLMDVEKTGGVGSLILEVDSSGFVKFSLSSLGTLCTSTSALTLNAWNRLAVTKSGTAVRLFKGGIIEATNTTANVMAATGRVSIGMDTSNGFQLRGWAIDEARICKVAKYTANYTPAVAPFT